MSEVRASVGHTTTPVTSADVELVADRGGVVRCMGPLVLQRDDGVDVSLEKKIAREVARALITYIGQMPETATLADLRIKLAADLATELLEVR